MSQIFRLFEPIIFRENTEISLTGDSSRILSRVLRKKAGDTIEILNGQGQVATATLKQVGSKTVTVSIDQTIQHKRLTPQIHLLMGCLKGEKLSWVIQKVMELGVDRISFFLADHSVAIKSSSILEKEQKTLIEAARQSGNPFLPELNFFKRIEDIDFSKERNHWNIVLDEKSDETVFSEALQSKPESISLFVGPEGGFSDQERDFLQSKGCRFTRIAPYVLRSETAAISAVAVCRAILK